MAKKRDLKSMIIPKLRQASRWWPPKKDARDKAKKKIQIGVFNNGNPKFKTYYQCAKCKELFDRKDTHMDHKRPVIDIKTGFVDWNTYIERLFVDVSGWQCLCTGCHKDKTAKENIKRKKSRKKKKS